MRSEKEVEDRLAKVKEEIMTHCQTFWDVSDKKEPSIRQTFTVLETQKRCLEWMLGEEPESKYALFYEVFKRFREMEERK